MIALVRSIYDPWSTLLVHAFELRIRHFFHYQYNLSVAVRTMCVQHRLLTSLLRDTH